MITGWMSIECGGVISAAMEWFQRGLITTKDTGGLELTWGNAEAVDKLIHQIGLRKGFGAILAEGADRAADKLGLPEGRPLLYHHHPRHDPARR